MAENTAYVFTRNAIAKLKADHVRLRAMYRNLATRQRAMEARSGLREDVIIGQFAEEVAARDGTNMTAGELTVHVLSQGGVFRETDRVETVYNWTGSAIPIDKYVIAHRDFRTGLWLGMAQDCA